MPRGLQTELLMKEGFLRECIDDLKNSLDDVESFEDLERLLKGALKGLEQRTDL